MTENARRDKRYPSEQPISVHCESWGEFAELYAADVSRGGMFILTQRPPPLLSEIEVALRLPEGHEMQLKATVVHVIDPEQAARENKRAGIGVQFNGLDAVRKQQIQQLTQFAHESSQSDANPSATYASRLFETTASLPPSKVLDALPAPLLARPQASGSSPAPGMASDRAASRRTGEQSLPPASRRTGEQSAPPASRRTGEQSAPPASRRAGEQSAPPASRRTGEQSLPPASRRTGEQSLPPASRRTGEQSVPPTSQRPGTSAGKRASRRTGEQQLPAANTRPPADEAADAAQPADASAATPAPPLPSTPSDPVKLKLGMTHFAHRRFDQAVKLFEELVAETNGDRPAQHWLHMSRARLCLKTNDGAGAAQAYQKALETDETNHEARKFVREYSTKKRLASLPFGRYFVKKE